jgi:glycosyltransferase involved in cell wall biosynthesis
LIDHEGIDLKVVADEGDPLPYAEDKVIRLSIPRKSTLLYLFRYFPVALFHFSSLTRLMKLKSDVAYVSRFKWALKMLPLTRLSHVDIVHLQWISFVAEYAWLKSFYKCIIVASARGTQVTIQPTLDANRLSLIRDAFSKTDYIHCVSNAILEQCKKWGADENKLKVIFNGIDTSVFAPSTPTKGSGPLTLIAVGALIWRKGYVYQLLLVNSLKQAGMNVRLDIVGEGEDTGLIRYTIEKLEIQNEVRLMGKLPPQEIVKLLQGSDIFISTSIAEGLSNSVIEAASTAVPCFVFNCEGMNEVIDEGKNGFIFPYGDIRAMRDKIIALANSPREVLRSLGGRAREKILADFEEAKCTGKLIEFYKAVAPN